MSLIWERYYPFLGGVALYLLWLKYGPFFPRDAEALLTSSLTLGAILTGFLATSKTILMGMRGEILADLRRSGYVEDLIKYLAHAIWSSCSFCLVVLFGFFLNSPTLLFESFWSLAGGVAGLAFFRVTKIVLKILRYEGASN